ncbi:unnamed protein product [Rotaria sp. Silwood1]|nr:unnamed protein product [Rotaria sp. Silwood1]CAF1643339.1 unnamed protein product [Rotaria sp. Silwood1]
MASSVIVPSVSLPTSSTANHVIIWLDQHIGLIKSNNQLKSAVGGQTDPHNVTPTSPNERDIGNLIRFQELLDTNFFGIPENLKAFYEIDSCLECIGENLANRKQIFFVTSGTMGEKILPKIAELYPSLKQIYLFCGYYRAHVGWAYDYLDQGFDIIMIDFHTDLVMRLSRDVAEYFISEGNGLMQGNSPVADSAVVYFRWAKLLLDRANNIAMVKVFDRLRYAENRMEVAEELISQLSGDDNDKVSHEQFP